MTEITNDISTRLLAQENLLINRAPVSTASFDVRNRILTLPMWSNMTPEIEEMLKAHEVGHALYTDESLFATIQAKNSKLPFGYLNILEDARIEKLMKRKYPGLRKSFTAGYTQLHDRDYFGLKKRDVNNLQLIDRINLHFKVGMSAGIKFSVAERYLVEKVERLESISDVSAVAVQIYDYVVREKERKKKERENDSEYKKMKLEQLQEIEEMQEPEFDDNDWAAESYDDTPDEDEDREEEQVEENAMVKQGTVDVHNENSETDEVEASETAGAFEQNLADAADTSTRYVYLTLPDTNRVPAIKVDYKTVLAETTAMLEFKRNETNSYGERDTFIEQLIKDYDVFKQDTNRIVNYLIKEFEMKKAASAYKRQHVAKTGVLDVAKLASYKIREDLFKQITITKDGQKHGMIFTIDWSGSMADYLGETVKQLISLVTFCYRCKIPFEVYAFSDNFDYNQREELDMRRVAMHSMYKAGNLSLGAQFRMIEFFNSKATLSEFNRMCRNIYIMSNGYRYRTDQREGTSSVTSKYELNGTPLNEAMVWLYNHIGNFKSKHNVEKLTLIKLTDGDGGAMNRYYDEKMHETWTSNVSYVWDEKKQMNNRVRTVAIMRDDVTKKTYNYEPYDVTNIVCKMIQDRYGATVVGYHVVGRGRRELMYTVQRYGIAAGASDEQDLAIRIRKGFNDEMFYPINLKGHDELFLLPNNMKVDDTDLDENMASMTSNQIAKKFGKYLGAKKTSRVLLNRFVGAIA